MSENSNYKDFLLGQNYKRFNRTHYDYLLDFKDYLIQQFDAYETEDGYCRLSLQEFRDIEKFFVYLFKMEAQGFINLNQIRNDKKKKFMQFLF